MLIMTCVKYAERLVMKIENPIILELRNFDRVKRSEGERRAEWIVYIFSIPFFYLCWVIIGLHQSVLCFHHNLVNKS